MKKLFYLGLLGLCLFEILNVYFIMPMPGSQEIESIDLAYFLFSWRWFIRGILIIVILFGSKAVIKLGKLVIPSVCVIFTLLIVFVLNFKLSADKMFLQTENLFFKGKIENKVSGDRLVICVDINGEQKAYPIEFLAYHHQVNDIVGGKKIMVTYCSVCRTGRVFEPNVGGVNDEFRLVGMDHFNALFEDKRTHSWWRQATGEAIAGPMKGKTLPEIESKQMSIAVCLSLFPNAKIMQADRAFFMEYDPQAKFEKGKSKNELTKTEKVSWRNKSWVIGVKIGDVSKAYDWNLLKKMRIINDKMNEVNIVIALATDKNSFIVFERPDESYLLLKNDSLISRNGAYSFFGKNSNGTALKSIAAYQEFWHSWLTFHPKTLRYQEL
jgi:hypothetical protein